MTAKWREERSGDCGGDGEGRSRLPALAHRTRDPRAGKRRRTQAAVTRSTTAHLLQTRSGREQGVVVVDVVDEREEAGASQSAGSVAAGAAVAVVVVVEGRAIYDPSQCVVRFMRVRVRERKGREAGR